LIGTVPIVPVIVNKFFYRDTGRGIRVGRTAAKTFLARAGLPKGLLVGALLGSGAVSAVSHTEFLQNVTEPILKKGKELNDAILGF
jgi:hypothetical protein